jgi:hypothetical protein
MESVCRDTRPMQTPTSPTFLRKARPAGEPQPWLLDYDAERAAFSWTKARALLDGLPGGAD